MPKQGLEKLQPQGRPKLIEPAQPIVWSRQPKRNNDGNDMYQKLKESTGSSPELIARQGTNPGIRYPMDNTNRARGIDAVVQPTMGPFTLSSPNDGLFLSPLQTLLRLNMEAFSATPLDVVVRIKGRNKPVSLNQVGIRCRHCAHIPALRRVKGAVYFPSTTLVYQAAQNMGSAHLQCGQCPEMPESIKTLFVQLLETKTASASSAGGRAYWAHCAQQRGLVNTESGIFHIGM
jgi:hypothetical protein